jgi:hypothetical protein
VVVAGSQVDVEPLDAGQPQVHSGGSSLHDHVSAVGNDGDGVGVGGAGHRYDVGGGATGDVDPVVDATVEDAHPGA